MYKIKKKLINFSRYINAMIIVKINSFIIRRLWSKMVNNQLDEYRKSISDEFNLNYYNRI